MGHSVRRHLIAQATALCVIVSTAAVPAAALAPSHTEPAGILSIIMRALERRRLRAEEQPPASVPPKHTSSQELESLYQHVFDRREERQRLLDASGGIQEAETPQKQDLERASTSKQQGNRTNTSTPYEELLNSVDQRRQLRETEQKQLRHREEQRQERSAGGQEGRMEARRTLREQRADLAEKREQHDVLRIAMLKAINNQRAGQNLPPLTYNKNLELAAQLHAEDMFIREYFDHFSPEGLSYVDRIKNIGYANVDKETCNCTAFKPMLGENLAKGQRSVNWAMNELMASPTHRKNILAPYFEEVGIGIAEHIWVQNFGAIEYTF